MAAASAVLWHYACAPLCTWLACEWAVARSLMYIFDIIACAVVVEKPFSAQSQYADLGTGG
jgi:hypothetical protein